MSFCKFLFAIFSNIFDCIDVAYKTLVQNSHIEHLDYLTKLYPTAVVEKNVSIKFMQYYGKFINNRMVQLVETVQQSNESTITHCKLTSSTLKSWIIRSKDFGKYMSNPTKYLEIVRGSWHVYIEYTLATQTVQNRNGLYLNVIYIEYHVVVTVWFDKTFHQNGNSFP